MLEVTYLTEKREIGILMEQIEKQYFTVGKSLQDFLVSKKQEEGSEIKNVREYMESQRGYVWETWRSSNLIQTILLNNPIPEITVYRIDNKSQYRKTVDGLQRLTSIYFFVNNQFKLDMSKTIFPEFTIEGETFNSSDLHGKTFSELPELWQDIIKSYQLRITTMNNCSEEFAEKAFVQMNSGAKGLKASEIRKAAMGLSTRKFFRTILNSDWVLHALTALSAQGNAGDEIISQVITLLHNNSPIELSKDNIDKVIYGLRDSGIPEQIKEDLTNVSDYLNQVTEIWINNKKKEDEKAGTKKGKKVSNYSTYRFPWLNKTHTVMLIYSAHKAIQSDMSVESFAVWSHDFFKDPKGEYKEGSTKDKAIDLLRVRQRMNAINVEITGEELEVAPEPQNQEQEEPELELSAKVNQSVSILTEGMASLKASQEKSEEVIEQPEQQELDQDVENAVDNINAIIENVA